MDKLQTAIKGKRMAIVLEDTEGQLYLVHRPQSSFKKGFDSNASEPPCPNCSDKNFLDHVLVALRAILPGSKSTEHPGADVRPELGQHVSDRSAHEAGADPGRHHAGSAAVMRIVEIGSRDTESHAEYSGEIECLFAGILPGENYLADRISGPVEDVLSGAFAIVPEVLVQNRRHGGAKQVLGGEIGNGSAEALGVRLTAIPILRVVVFPLRKG